MLSLSLGLAVNARTRALFDGRITPEGVHLTVSRVLGSELYWRQLMFAEFDISDLSMASLLIAIDRADQRWIALPVFSLRKFFHTWAIVRADSGISSPLDLHGRRVGVPEYQQTSAVWTRGILADEFGVDWRRIRWVMERPPSRSHGGATGFLPGDDLTLSYAAEDTNLAAMLLAGELDAALQLLSVPNLVDRGQPTLEGSPEIRPLFDQAEATRYYDKTGIFPLNHCVVIRRALVEKYPWLPLNVFAHLSALGTSPSRKAWTHLNR
jgi:4,5-dihydroxyphthalate decarboxylase